MPLQVHGPTAYHLTTGHMSPFTKEQVGILLKVYSEFGLKFNSGIWKGKPCVFVKAPAEKYKAFIGNAERSGQNITKLLGTQFESHTNSYVPGNTYFSPGADWDDVVEFIDANYNEKALAPSREPSDRDAATQKIAWQCPQCNRRYKVQAGRPLPKVCPECRGAKQEASNPKDHQPNENADRHQPVPNYGRKDSKLAAGIALVVGLLPLVFGGVLLLGAIGRGLPAILFSGAIFFLGAGICIKAVVDLFK